MSVTQSADPAAVVIKNSIEKGGISWRIRATVPNLECVRSHIDRGNEHDSRSVLQLAPTNTFLSLLLGHIQQVKVTPVMQGTGTIAS